MKAIRVTTPGGPEALTVAEVATPTPGAGEALIRIEAIGVNYIDVYHRSGFYKLPTPFTPGSEGSGVVQEVGPGTPGVKAGERVAFSHLGSYAQYVIVPVAKLVPLPDEIDFRTAAAGLLQGVTAQYLTTSTLALQSGQKALIHAAAGGVGGILVQLAKARGAYVFGTASTPKLDIVREAGADLAIDYTTDDFVKRVLDETSGEGVDVVYDSVGKTTLDSR
jgi:NADPH2:quinone reductase